MFCSSWLPGPEVYCMCTAIGLVWGWSVRRGRLGVFWFWCGSGPALGCSGCDMLEVLWYPPSLRFYDMGSRHVVWQFMNVSDVGS